MKAEGEVMKTRNAQILVLGVLLLFANAPVLAKSSVIVSRPAGFAIPAYRGNPAYRVVPGNRVSRGYRPVPAYRATPGRHPTPAYRGTPAHRLNITNNTVRRGNAWTR